MALRALLYRFGTGYKEMANGDQLPGYDQTDNPSILGLIAGTVPAVYPPRRGQFFRALEAFQAGATSTVAAAIPSDPGDATNIAFNHATFIVQVGTLAQFVKTTLGLTDAQLTTIISNARSVTE